MSAFALIPVVRGINPELSHRRGILRGSVKNALEVGPFDSLIGNQPSSQVGQLIPVFPYDVLGGLLGFV